MHEKTDFDVIAAMRIAAAANHVRTFQTTLVVRVVEVLQQHVFVECVSHQPLTKHPAGPVNRTQQGVDIRLAVVDAKAGTCGGSQAEMLHQRLAAMMPGA